MRTLIIAVWLAAAADAYCGEIAAPAPVPVRREAGAVVVVASAVVLLAAWAFARLLCAMTRVRRRHQPS